jgi:hypothetical protein
MGSQVRGSSREKALSAPRLSPRPRHACASVCTYPFAQERARPPRSGELTGIGTGPRRCRYPRRSCKTRSPSRSRTRRRRGKCSRRTPRRRRSRTTGERHTLSAMVCTARAKQKRSHRGLRRCLLRVAERPSGRSRSRTRRRRTRRSRPPLSPRTRSRGRPSRTQCSKRPPRPPLATGTPRSARAIG